MRSRTHAAFCSFAAAASIALAGCETVEVRDPIYRTQKVYVPGERAPVDTGGAYITPGPTPGMEVHRRE